MSRSSFLRAVAGMWCVFLSVGVLIPLLPTWVAHELAGTGWQVGLTVFIYALASVAGRPFAGWYLRSRPAEPLMALSVTVAVIALTATPVVHALWWTWMLRFVEGVAVGLFYTAAATGVVRSTAPQHRGSRLAYFSVPLFLGVALGPILGDWSLLHLGPAWSWVLAGGIMLLTLASCPPHARLFAAAPPAGPAERGQLLKSLAHPAARMPAIILALSIAGWAAFQAFVPLYGPLIGARTTGTVFLSYSIVVLVIRTAGARLFDRLPIVEMVAFGCVANVAGLLVVTAWRHPASLYAAAILMAVAIGLTYTSLMQVALTGVPPADEGSVVAAYSVAYDVGAGLGAAALGMLLTWTGSYQWVFLGGAIAAAWALGLLLSHYWPKRGCFAARPVPVLD